MTNKNIKYNQFLEELDSWCKQHNKEHKVET